MRNNRLLRAKVRCEYPLLLGGDALNRIGRSVPAGTRHARADRRQINGLAHGRGVRRRPLERMSCHRFYVTFPDTGAGREPAAADRLPWPAAPSTVPTSLNSQARKTRA